MSAAVKLRHQMLTPLAVVLISLAFVWLRPHPNWSWLSLPVRVALATIFVAAGVGVAGHFQRRLVRQINAARRRLLLLSQFDEGEFLDGVSDRLPPLEADNPWADCCDAVQARLAQFAEQAHGAEQGKAHAELRVHKLDGQRRRACDVLEALAAPVLAVNEYDEVLLANPSACELLGVDEDPRGRSLAELSPPAKLAELLASARRRHLSAGRAAEIEWDDAEGNSHAFRVTCRTLEDRSSEHPQGTVAVLENISDRRALQRRNAEFVSAASHEIKAPLSGIKAYVELLVDGDMPDEESRDEFLEIINSQADRLQRLIDNLLNLARIEAGVESVNKTSRSLNELLEEALRVVQLAAESKSINVVNELSPMYLGVLVDRDMLLQAAINLLSNAVKYTGDGGSVTLRSRMEDTRVSFEVEDTGVGLSEEDCRRIFEKFYRVADSREMAPGTGLGLTLAKHIVEDVHGGALSVRSQLGEGTVFRVTLPRHVQAKVDLE